MPIFLANKKLALVMLSVMTSLVLQKEDENGSASVSKFGEVKVLN